MTAAIPFLEVCELVLLQCTSLGLVDMRVREGNITPFSLWILTIFFVCFFSFYFTITVLLIIIINLDIIISYYNYCYHYSGFYSFPSRSSCSQQPGMVARGLWAETTYSAQILPAWRTIRARVAWQPPGAGSCHGQEGRGRSSVNNVFVNLVSLYPCTWAFAGWNRPLCLYCRAPAPCQKDLTLSNCKFCEYYWIFCEANILACNIL